MLLRTYGERSKCCTERQETWQAVGAHMQSFSLGHPPPDLLQAGPYAGPVAMTHNKEKYIQCQPTGGRRQGQMCDDKPSRTMCGERSKSQGGPAPICHTCQFLWCEQSHHNF